MTTENYDLQNIPQDIQDMVHVALPVFANKVGWTLTEANDFNDLLDLKHDLQGLVVNICEIESVIKSQNIFKEENNE